MELENIQVGDSKEYQGKSKSDQSGDKNVGAARSILKACHCRWEHTHAFVTDEELNY